MERDLHHTTSGTTRPATASFVDMAVVIDLVERELGGRCSDPDEFDEIASRLGFAA